MTIRAAAMKDATASNTSGSFTGQIDSPASSNVVLTGIMSLRLQPQAGANNYNDDNKTLDGAYSIIFNKQNVAGGNGDTYFLTASFTPTAGQFESMVGDYVGTVNVTVEY
ncbi:hypothetical protein [Deinococcus multiflagellatus]|uniref:Spore coat protein U domain-containing protein n=1 Tax=Deinococcus multiflagellatus TaxID=1656887 RepID=A0ABW1ZL40_9DEIO